jgi:hypothetical protein
MVLHQAGVFLTRFGSPAGERQDRDAVREHAPRPPPRPAGNVQQLPRRQAAPCRSESAATYIPALIGELVLGGAR